MKKILLLFVLFAVVNLAADRLTGIVIDHNNEKAVNAAAVLITDLQMATYSKSDGSFEFDKLKPGIYQIAVQRIGYEPKSVKIIFPDENMITIRLTSNVTNINGITVAATRAKKRETPVTFSSLPKETIAMNNYGQDLPMLMGDLPNVYSYSDAGTGMGYSYLKIRGFDQKRIGVMINGIPLNDPEDHAVYWVNMPDFGESLSDIQFQRGVGSSMYGVSTFGGSLNMNTSNISDPSSYEFFANYGSFNTYKTGVKLAQNLLNNFKINLRFSLLGSEGYRDNSDTELHSYYANVSRLGERSVTEINFYGGNEVTHAAWYASCEEDLTENHQHNPITYDNEIDDFSQPHLEIHHNYRLTEQMDMKNSLFYIYGDGLYEQLKEGRDLWEYGLAEEPESIESDLIRQKMVTKNQVGWVGQFNWDHLKGNLTIGSYLSHFESNHWGEIKELLSDEAVNQFKPGFKYYQYKGQKQYLSLFASENYRIIPDLNLMMNLQYQHISYDFDQKNAGNFQGEYLNSYTVDYDFLSPRLGINYNVNKYLNLYVNYSAAKREPTDDELYDTWDGPDDLGVPPLFAQADTIYDSFGNIEHVKWSDPQVKEEELRDFELGIGFNDLGWDISANFYNMVFKNEIISYGGVDEDGSPIRGNADRTIHRGFELNFNRILPWNISFSSNIAWSQNYFDAFIMYDWDDDYNVVKIDYKDKTIAGFPEILGNIALVYDLEPFVMQVKMNYAGKQYLDNTENDDRIIDSYQLFGLNCMYTFSDFIADYDVTLSCKIENILDTTFETSGYYDPWGGSDWSGANYYFPGAGRTIIGGIRISF